MRALLRPRDWGAARVFLTFGAAQFAWLTLGLAVGFVTGVAPLPPPMEDGVGPVGHVVRGIVLAPAAAVVVTLLACGPGFFLNALSASVARAIAGRVPLAVVLAMAPVAGFAMAVWFTVCSTALAFGDDLEADPPPGLGWLLLLAAVATFGFLPPLLAGWWPIRRRFAAVRPPSPPAGTS